MDSTSERHFSMLEWLSEIFVLTPTNSFFSTHFLLPDTWCQFLISVSGLSLHKLNLLGKVYSLGAGLIMLSLHLLYLGFQSRGLSGQRLNSSGIPRCYRYLVAFILPDCLRVSSDQAFSACWMLNFNWPSLSFCSVDSFYKGSIDWDWFISFVCLSSLDFTEAMLEYIVLSLASIQVNLAFMLLMVTFICTKSF